jgi:hypothetical protein
MIRRHRTHSSSAISGGGGSILTIHQTPPSTKDDPIHSINQYPLAIAQS